MNKKALWVQTLILLLFLAAGFILHIAIPDKSFSQQENRMLQTLPEFSFKDLFSGEFMTDFEDYVTDQFPLRDKWISLKARTELATGKDQNNGIYLCENQQLLECFTYPSQEALDTNLQAVNALAEKNDIPVYFALIPSSAEIYSELLPEGAPNDSQRELIEYAYSASPANCIDVYSALEEHAGEKIYYRTDHHWTSLGAYYGYTAIAQAMGFEPVALNSYTEKVVTQDFLGTVYSSSGFSWIEPESISTYVEQGSAVITNYPSGSAVESSLYVESFLQEKDKYSYFYGGNTPLLTIQTENTDAPSLLIIRDSYMDSLSPFMFEHFSNIHIIDLRYFRTSLSAYIQQNNIDNILVCYSVANFSTDGNIFMMAY